MKEVKVFLQRCVLVACEINRLNLQVSTKCDKQIRKKPILDSLASKTQISPSKLSREQNNKIIALRKQLAESEKKLSHKETLIKSLGPENQALREKLKSFTKTGQDTEKVYAKYNNILSLYNKLTVDHKYLRKEFESLKSSQSSGTFMNKIKQEVEQHQKTKDAFEELSLKYKKILKEYESTRKNQLRSIVSPKKSDGEDVSQISEINDISQENDNQFDNTDFLEVIEKMDVSNIPSRVIEVFKNEIKKRDDYIIKKNKENQELNQQLKDTQIDLEKVQDDNDIARRFNSSVTEQNLKLKTDNVNLADKISSLLEKIDEMSKTFSKSREEFNEKIENYEQINENLTNSNSDLTYKISQSEINRRKYPCICSDAKNSMATQNQVINELRSQLSDLKSKLCMYEEKYKGVNGSLELGDKTSNNHFDINTNSVSSSDQLTNRVLELLSEVEMKDKLIRFFMTGYPDIDLKNFFSNGKDVSSANFVNIYNESITKMQKILEEQLLKNIDLDQNLSQAILENNLLTEEIKKARAILNAK